MDLSVKNMSVETALGRRLIAVPELVVPSGSSLVIRGPSGAGKTSLLFAIAGLVPVTKGLLRWGETDITGLSDHARTRFRGSSFGIIFQDHLLFEELTAEENASLAALYAPRARRAGLEKAAGRLLTELGLPSKDRRSVSGFSGGERQRIAVARALAAEPPVILADEPTASLDRATADALIADLFGAARRDGRTLIAVSHDPKLMAAADHLLTVEDGAVSAYV